MAVPYYLAKLFVYAFCKLLQVMGLSPRPASAFFGNFEMVADEWNNSYIGGRFLQFNGGNCHDPIDKLICTLDFMFEGAGDLQHARLSEMRRKDLHPDG